MRFISVSPRGSLISRLLGVCAALVGAACGEGEPKEGFGPPPSDTVVSVLEVLPDSVSLLDTESAQFSVFGRTAAGDSMPATVMWEASGGSITPAGVFAPADSGVFWVIARGIGPEWESGRDRRRDSSRVRVHGLTTVVITPAAVTLSPGAEHQFAAEGVWRNGTTRPVSASWSATGGTITPGGRYTAGSSAGTFRVVGTYRNRADTAVVTIASAPPTLTGVVVTPTSVSLGEGLQQQFTATAQYSDGSSNGVTATWSATGGTIGNGGLYTAGSTAGTFRVIGTYQGRADTSSVTITASPPTLNGVVVTPASAALDAGQTQQFTATAQYSDGSSNGVTATWSATGGSIGSGGLYTAGSTAGTFRVIGTYQGRSDTSTVTIAASGPTLTGLVVTPPTTTLSPVWTEQFTATAQYSDGSSSAVTATWNATGGTITAGGLYTAGSSPGTFRVIGTYQGRADTSAVTITVPTPTLTAVVVAPSSTTLNGGQTQQFNATAQYSDGSSNAVTPTWNATGGTIGSGGLYTAGSTAGTFGVIGTYQGLADTASVTIASSGTVTIINTDFESNPNLNTLFDDRGNAQNHRIVTDPALARSGSRSLEITYPAGGSGGWLTRFFMPGYQTSARISVWIRLQSGWQGVTRLLGLQGSHISDQWSATGVAGVCPEVGKAPNFLQFFTSVVQQSPTENGALRYYNQFLGMPAAPGNCWSITGEGGGFGTATFTPRNFYLTPGQWHFLEMEVVLNTPGAANGSHRFWVDGVLRGEWTGIRWRDTPDVRLNSATLMVHSTSPQTQRLWFDDLVVTAVP